MSAIPIGGDLVGFYAGARGGSGCVHRVEYSIDAQLGTCLLGGAGI
jgi:hypothetical protein